MDHCGTGDSPGTAGEGSGDELQRPQHGRVTDVLGLTPSGAKISHETHPDPRPGGDRPLLTKKIEFLNAQHTILKLSSSSFQWCKRLRYDRNKICPFHCPKAI